MALLSDSQQRALDELRGWVEGILEEDDLPDFHTAFEEYACRKYGLGEGAETERTGGSNDRGIDGYSLEGNTLHLIQAKTPQTDWLAANRGKIQPMGPKVVDDAREAREYLFGETHGKANNAVARLYSRVQLASGADDFKVAYHLVLFGVLNKRGQAAFEKEKSDWETIGGRLVLHELPGLASDFEDAPTAEAKIRVRLTVFNEQALNHHQYHYFLTSAADLFKAHSDYGYRLFDLNVRGWLRSSSVNGRILDTLASSKGRKIFHHLNNGIIIVADHIQFSSSGNEATINKAQIVNGLQTTMAIHSAVQDKQVELDSLRDCKVQVKVIVNPDRAFIDQVVQTTNDQNPMKPRNLKANTQEQRNLRRKFASLNPRWFYEVKQEEWRSLANENRDIFKQIVNFKFSDFIVSGKRPRRVDNEKAAKAYLSFLGFSDWAADRTAHYFAKPEIYRTAFLSSATADHWSSFASNRDFRKTREQTLQAQQGDAWQYLLAYGIWEAVRTYIPSSQENRGDALQRGVNAGELHKSSGSITDPLQRQEEVLSRDMTYQAWRLMSNMKEALVETITRYLVQRYGDLGAENCEAILRKFDLSTFVSTADTMSLTGAARQESVSEDDVFGRCLSFLHYASGQFFLDNSTRLLAASRLKMEMLKPDVWLSYNRFIDSTASREALDRPWKGSGVTFVGSLPPL